MALEIINVDEWIEENSSSFVPPVCNKLMHGAGQLKVMFVGGPNQRKDYHIEEGEEFFFQLKGNMCLKIVEKNQHKDIHIKEGERFENTVGVVFERERSKEEKDGLRYYVDGTVDPLWEEWFHCYDLGTQLGPVIKRYFASEEHKTGKPPPGKVFGPPPVKLDVTTTTHQPLSLKKWIEDNAAEIQEKGFKPLFNNGEFKVLLHGEGEQTAENPGETFLWQMEGEAEVTCPRGSGKLTKGNSVLIKAREKFTIKRSAGSVGMSVVTDPLANK